MPCLIQWLYRARFYLSVECFDDGLYGCIIVDAGFCLILAGIDTFLLAFCRGETVAGWRDAAHFELDFSDPVTSAAERALGLSSDLCGLAVLRGQRFKYVHFAGLPPLLFDMVADPHERRDLAGDPDYAAVVLDCAQRLLSWRLAHADRSLTRYRGSPDGLTIDGRLIGTRS